MEAKRRKIWIEWENEIRMKSRATWLECSDDNTNFFHHFVCHRKNVNYVWSIKSDEGFVVDGFEGICSTRIQHFQDLFKAKDNIDVVEIVKIASFFPTKVSNEDNRMLMEEVSLNELKDLMGQFKYKNLGPDGLPIKFYSSLFNILGNDIMSVIEESKLRGKISGKIKWEHTYNRRTLYLHPNGWT